MANSNIIKWWKYASCWKLFICAILCVAISFSVVFLIDSAWSLLLVLLIVFGSGYFMYKMIPNVLKDLEKELNK